MLLPIFLWRHASPSLERAGETGGILKSYGAANLGDARVGFPEQPSRLLLAQQGDLLAQAGACVLQFGSERALFESTNLGRLGDRKISQVQVGCKHRLLTGAWGTASENFTRRSVSSPENPRRLRFY